MATATASGRKGSTHKQPPRSQWRRHVEERAHTHPGDEAPWSDEERTAAGQRPVGEGPGAPGSARADRNRQRRAQFEAEAADKEARDKKTAEDKAQAERDAEHREQRRQAGQVATTATGGLKGLLEGKGGGTVAGTVLGLILFAMGNALLNGGPAELAGWLKAKFFNEPYTGASSTATATSSSSPIVTLASYQVPASSGSPASVVGSAATGEAAAQVAAAVVA